jgi:protein O-mannosyl-transferase
LSMALGLAAKPMLVTLPCVLLLLDLWPLGRRGLGRLILEKILLFTLSAASSVVTLHYQKASLAPLEALPWDLRLSNAAVSYVTYLGKAFLPRDLAVFYPFPPQIPIWQAVGSAALIIVLTGLAVWRVRKSPWLLVGWLWFLGTLVPVIGLVQVGRQAMADRYTYLPFAGLFLAMVWGLAELVAQRAVLRRALGVVAVLAVLILTAMTRSQARHWADSVTLFRHALAVTGDNDLARIGLAKALAARREEEGNAVREAQPRDEEDGGRLRPEAPDL